MRRGIWCPRHPDERLVRILCPDGKIDLRCNACTRARVSTIKIVEANSRMERRN